MPYVLHGLGSRANNFIEELYIGVSYRQVEHFKEWSGIIPNSQLVMMPYQPDNSIGISTWVLELFINPSKYANWVLVFVVVVMLILSAVVLLLQQLENVSCFILFDLINNREPMSEKKSKRRMI